MIEKGGRLCQILFWSGPGGELFRDRDRVLPVYYVGSRHVGRYNTIQIPHHGSLRVSSYVVLRSSSYSIISSSSSSSSCSASARRCSSSISRFCRSISFSAEMTSRARRTNAGTAPSPAGCQSSSVRTPIPKIASTVLDPVDVRVSVVWYRGLAERPT